MTERIRVAARGELSSGSCKTVEASGRTIALYNVEGTFYATDNTCAHQGGPLGEGLLDGTTVTCPWHAWQFDVCTGQSAFSIDHRVEVFPVVVEGDDVFVEI